MDGRWLGASARRGPLCSAIAYRALWYRRWWAFGVAARQALWLKNAPRIRTHRLSIVAR